MDERFNGEMWLVGPPGTGKTHTLARQVEAALEHYGWEPGSATAPVTVCSLTKAAAHEIAGRIVALPKAQVGTLHSLALHSLGGGEDGARLQVAEGKKIAKKWNDENPSLAITGEGGGGPRGWDSGPGKAPGDGPKAKADLCRHRMIDRRLWPGDAKEFYARWEPWVRENGAVDFTGMLERAMDESPFAPGNPRLIMADEVQDFSRLELSLLKRWARAARGMIVSGDPRQSIYGWRGASPDVFDGAPEGRLKVIGQSYRVPRSVHAVSEIWARRLSSWASINYLPRDAEGFARVSGFFFRDADEIARTVEEVTSKEEECEVCGGSGKFYTGAECRSCRGAGRRRPTAIICASCDYMLAPVIRALRSRGVPFANPWREENGAWNPMRRSRGGETTSAGRILSFLRPDPATWEHQPGPCGPDLLSRDSNPPWTSHEALTWMGLMRAEGVLKRGEKAWIEEATKGEDPIPFSDLMSALEPEALESLGQAVAWAETSRDRDGTKAMLRWLRDHVGAKTMERMDFPVSVAARSGGKALLDPPRVFTGTIHSFKGAEADYVFLSPDVSGAGMEEWGGDSKQRDAVIRLFYVALTRARKGVFLCQPSDRRRNVFAELEEVFISAGRKTKGDSKCPF